MEIVITLSDDQLDAIARRVAEVRPVEIRQRLLDVPKASVYLGVTEHALREYIRHYRIPTVRANGRVLFDTHDLEKWIARHKCTEA